VSAAYELPSIKDGCHEGHVLGGRTLGGQYQVRSLGWFVGIVDAADALEFAAPVTSIKAFRVASLTHG
jgi:hypothetical protein